MKKYLSVGLIFFILSYCSSPSETTITPERPRIGAKCKDGTITTATGSGACSNHGGVDYWLY